MRTFDYVVTGYRGDFTVKACEPFEGSAFIAQQERNRKTWVVTHRRTTLIAHCPREGTKKAALEAAKKLSETCPSAPKVGVKRTGEGFKLTGPHRKLINEVAAFNGGVRSAYPKDIAPV